MVVDCPDHSRKNSCSMLNSLAWCPEVRGNISNADIYKWNRRAHSFLSFSFLSSKVHKGRWSTEEDEVLLEAVRRHLNNDPHSSNTTTTSNNIMPWNHIAEHIPNRTGIQCQSRWTEALDPAVRKGRWNKEEDELLRQAVLQLGCCWIRVAGCIPSRTQRQCRTRWNQIKNTRQSKRRPSEQQQDHQPMRTNKPSLPPASSMTTLSLGNNILTNSRPPSSPSDSPPPSTPPTCIPAMIIPSSDYPHSISTAPPSSSYPTSLASINIPKDPFSFLLDHDLPSSFLTTSTSSSLNHLENWFYGSSHWKLRWASLTTTYIHSSYWLLVTLLLLLHYLLHSHFLLVSLYIYHSRLPTINDYGFMYVSLYWRRISDQASARSSSTNNQTHPPIKHHYL